ncbi:protein NO VEIN domain-containing protein [Dactylosporangium sp. McL0621]|uniref:protein NO VEIN domain-containing protein n=1 Tax=Dactylosporangium sp. McL0621 TaxID=3415678 RepID=UPI003CF31112
MDAFWWSGRADENLFMEITRREDIGRDLRAPLAARGGVDTPGYTLVSAVQAGSVVVHYDSAAEQIVGVSRATGERFNQPIWWAARGSYARKAGVRPEWLPGLVVALEDYRRLATPLSLTAIRQRRAALLAIRDALQAEHPGHSLYFPWIPYQGSLRTFQTYLAKLPRAALDVLPEVRTAAAELVDEPSLPTSVQPEVDEAERDVASAAGRPRPPRKGKGQGFATSQRAKVVVEAYAMNAALLYYGKIGKVTDTSRTESYDYVIEINGELWHVEVKGTTGDPEDVLLTPREVEHANKYPRVSLFVLSNITVTRDEHDELTASGGKMSVFHPWSLDPSRLSPLGYKYRLPEKGKLSGL